MLSSIYTDTGYPKNVEWSDIPGYKGYQASPDGLILDVRKGRLKKQRRTKYGATRVDIGKSSVTVATLVARAFHGHPLCRGYRVKHCNGDLSDNQIENLMWSGRSRGRQQRPTLAVAVQDEYDRILEERNSLIELMQT